MAPPGCRRFASALQEGKRETVRLE
jgi:hypothetical protein